MMERQGSSMRRMRDGIIETVAGTGARGYAGDGHDARHAVFNAPKEMAVDPAGNIFIVDTENHVIRLIDAQSWIVPTIAGNGKAGPDGLARPHGAVVGADGAVYIGDSENHRVCKLVRRGPDAADGTEPPVGRGGRGRGPNSAFTPRAVIVDVL